MKRKVARPKKTAVVICREMISDMTCEDWEVQLLLAFENALKETYEKAYNKGWNDRDKEVN